MRHHSLDRETAEVDVEVVFARDDKDAILLRHDDTGQEEWVPKSLIEDPDKLIDEDGASTTVEIALWKLEDMGWV